jgi:putative endonuclease
MNKRTTITKEKSIARINTGKNAEDAAADFLQANGHTIIARNLRLGHLEIDLLATLPDTNLLIVVEVKARRAGTHAPELRVDWRKRRHLIMAAQMLLSRRMFRGKQIQFDVVAVEMDQLQKPQSLRHIQRAFDANLKF